MSWHQPPVTPRTTSFCRLRSFSSSCSGGNGVVQGRRSRRLALCLLLERWSQTQRAAGDDSRRHSAAPRQPPARPTLRRSARCRPPTFPLAAFSSSFASDQSSGRAACPSAGGAAASPLCCRLLRRPVSLPCARGRCRAQQPGRGCRHAAPLGCAVRWLDAAGWQARHCLTTWPLGWGGRLYVVVGRLAP